MMVQFLKCEITCSIIQRILLTWVLYSFLPVEQLAACGLPVGRDHVVSDVSFVPDPVLRVHRQQYAGLFLAVVVVTASVGRVGDPGGVSLNGAGVPEVRPGGCG